MAGHRWAASAEAGCLYALIVFVVGFVFGAVRVLLIAPRLGETAAVSIEAPFMLAASWNLSRWISIGAAPSSKQPEITY